jgi:CheY-like chemotaxis protein
VARAVEAASALIERRGHDLSIKLPRGSLQIHADPVRVEQILFNLLQNSAKYTDPAGCISLSARVEEDTVEIRVRDTGIGIAPESLERVFLPFEQVSDRRAVSRGGIGVGLALVKGLVELHGGTVGVTSAGLGYGTEFIIRLPGLISSEADPDEALATVTPFPALPSGARTGRVLVVDDNVDAADALGEALQGEGYEVRVVYDGTTALTTAAEFEPAVIVLDLGLPEIDGYEVARRLREKSEHASTLIVALTGFGTESDHQRSRLAGFDEHLVKPADLEVLFDIIRQRFRRAASTVTA